MEEKKGCNRDCQMEFCRYIKNWKCTKEDPYIAPSGTCMDFRGRSLNGKYCDKLIDGKYLVIE